MQKSVASLLLELARAAAVELSHLGLEAAASRQDEVNLTLNNDIHKMLEYYFWHTVFNYALILLI